MLISIGITMETKPILYIDNTAALSCIQEGEISKKSKHIEVKYFYVKEQVDKGILDVKYVRSEDQKADIFTKALHAPQFQTLSHSIGMSSRA